MAEQNHKAKPQPDQKKPPKNSPAGPIEQVSDVSSLLELTGRQDLLSGGSIVNQAALLTDNRWQSAQSQSIASQIGRMQGNRHLQSLVLQRKPIKTQQDSDEESKGRTLSHRQFSTAIDQALLTREQKSQASELLSISDRVSMIRQSANDARNQPSAPVTPEVMGYRTGYTHAVSRLAIQREPTDETAPTPNSPSAPIRAETRTELPTLEQAARDLTLWFAMPNPGAHKEQIFRTMLLLRGQGAELQAAFEQNAGRELFAAIDAGLAVNDAIRAIRYLQYGTLRLADKIFFAAKGMATDEDTLYRLLPQAHASLATVDNDFRTDYGQDYSSDGRQPNGNTSRIAGVIDSEMSGWELDKAKALLTYGELRPVDEIRIATNQVGTDEDMLFRALEHCNKATIRQEYQASYLENLDEVLGSELSGDDKTRADLILSGQYNALERIRLAVDGWGTDEKAIFDAISQASPEERAGLQAQFSDHGSALYQMLDGDLDSDAMSRIQALLRTSETNTALDQLRQAGALDGSDLVDEVKKSSSGKFDKYRSEYNRIGSEFTTYLQEHTDEDERHALAVVLNGSVEARLRWAVEGAGTDEDYIFHVLENFTDDAAKRELAQNESLMDALESDLSTRDFNRVKDLLRPSNMGIEERAAATEEQIETERSWLTDLFSNSSDALSDENRELQASLDRARADGEISPEEQAEINHFQSETTASLEVYKTVRNEIEDTAATVLSTAAAILVGVLSAGTLSGASAAMIAAQLAQAALVSAVAKVAAMKVARGDRFDVFGADGAMAFGSGAIDGVLNVVGAGAAEGLVGSMIGNVAKEATEQAAATGFGTLGRELLTKAVEGGISGSGSAVFESAANEDTWKRGFVDGIGNVALSTSMAAGMGAAGGVGMHLAGRGYSALSERFGHGLAEAAEESEQALAHSATAGEPVVDTTQPLTNEPSAIGNRAELTTSGPPASPTINPGGNEGLGLTILNDHPNVMVDTSIEGFEMDRLLKELDSTPQGARIAEQIRSGDIEILITRDELFTGYAATQVGNELHATWGGSVEETAASLVHEGTHGLDPDRFIPGIVNENAASRLSFEGSARAFEYEYRMQAGLAPYDEVERSYRETLQRVFAETGDERLARIAADREMLDAMRADPLRYGVETPAMEAGRLERLRETPNLGELPSASFTPPESSLENESFSDLASEPPQSGIFSDEVTQPGINPREDIIPAGGNGSGSKLPLQPPKPSRPSGSTPGNNITERIASLQDRYEQVFINDSRYLDRLDRLEHLSKDPTRLDEALQLAHQLESDLHRASDNLDVINESQLKGNANTETRITGELDEAPEAGAIRSDEEASFTGKQRSPAGTEIQPGDDWKNARGGMWGGENSLDVRKGHAEWYSDIPEVTAITKGEPVVYKDGYPDFRPWSKDEVRIPEMTGVNGDDFPLANKALAYQKVTAGEDLAIWFKNDGTPNMAQVERYMKGDNEWGQQLTWHHVEDGTTMLAVPTDLHGNVPHIGGASRAKNQ